MTSGAASVTVQNFTMNITSPVSLGSTGRLDFYVGATAIVSASQAGGSYNGSFTVDAVYQ